MPPWDGLQCSKFASNFSNIRIFESTEKQIRSPVYVFFFMHTLKMYASELIGLYWKSMFRRIPDLNTLSTGAFKLFKCTFPGSKQFKSTFILCFFKYNKFSNYFCELKVSGNTHQRP